LDIFFPKCLLCSTLEKKLTAVFLQKYKQDGALHRKESFVAKVTNLTKFSETIVCWFGKKRQLVSLKGFLMGILVQ
jgi:hypothetical protein